MTSQPPHKPGDSAPGGATLTNSIDEAYAGAPSTNQPQPCNCLCRAKEDVKKFMTSLATKQATLAGWLTQLDGPCSQRVQQWLVSCIEPF